MRYTLLFLLVLSISFALLSSNLSNNKFFLEKDEGFYLRYATYLIQNGLSGISDLFKNYTSNPSYCFHPSPLRIGYIAIAALFVKIFGASCWSLAYLSLISFYLFLTVNFYFISKYFDKKVALLSGILLAFSPLNLAMAKRALTESILNLFSVLTIWIFFDLVKERRNWKYFLFLAVFLLTILIKETSVLFSIIFMVFLLIRRLFYNKQIYLKDFLFIFVIPTATVFIIYLGLTGSPYFLFELFKVIFRDQTTNTYILVAGGPWFRYIIDYILISPWVVILTIGFIFYYLASQDYSETIIYLFVVFLLSFILFNMFAKNLRYVIVLDMQMRLFSILMLTSLFGRLVNKKAAYFVVFFVVMIAISDYISFNYLFVKLGIYDPVSIFLLIARHLSFPIQ